MKTCKLILKKRVSDMWLKCIRNKNYKDLTVGEVYECEDVVLYSVGPAVYLIGGDYYPETLFERCQNPNPDTDAEAEYRDNAIKQAEQIRADVKKLTGVDLNDIPVVIVGGD